MGDSSLDSTLNYTLTDEEHERMNVLLEKVCKDMDAAQRSEWKLALLQRYEQLCSRYKQMAEEIGTENIDWADVAEELQTTLIIANNEYKRMLGCAELLADASLLKSIGNLLLAKMKSFLLANVNIKCGISVDEFAIKLSRYYGPQEEEHEENFGDGSPSMWACLAELDFKSQPVPFGTLYAVRIQLLDEVQVDKQVAPRTRERLQNVETIRLMGAMPGNGRDDGSQGMPQILDKLVMCLRNELNRLGTNHMGYYEFVLHPTDFSKTVENIFHVSFLVNERRVLMWIPHGGSPQLALITEESADRPLKRCVISITQPEWRELVRTLGIKEPVVCLGRSEASD